MKFDMHCHTREGSPDGKVPIEEYIALLRKQGFDGMLVTDHDSYDGYREWDENIRGKKYPDFVVLKGIEYDTLDAGHILVIMPEHVSLKILELRGLTVKLLCEIVHHHGGILGPAHPCGEKFLSTFHTGLYKRHRDIAGRFDFLEGFNSCESPENNREAMEIGKKYGKPCFGGSDAHKADNVGLAYTEIDEDIRTESDLIRYIKNGGKPRCGGEYYHGTIKEKLGWWNIFLVDAFWFYNRFLALRKRRHRHHELRKSRENKGCNTNNP